MNLNINKSKTPEQTAQGHPGQGHLPTSRFLRCIKDSEKQTRGAHPSRGHRITSGPSQLPSGAQVSVLQALWESGRWVVLLWAPPRWAAVTGGLRRLSCSCNYWLLVSSLQVPTSSILHPWLVGGLQIGLRSGQAALEPVQAWGRVWVGEGGRAGPGVGPCLW